MQSPSKIEEQPLLTLKDVARFLCLSRQTVWTLCKAGELHPIKLKRAVRFSWEELQRFIAARRQ
jgi:excisionase family DNA binding protein